MTERTIPVPISFLQAIAGGWLDRPAARREAARYAQNLIERAREPEPLNELEEKARALVDALLEEVYGEARVEMAPTGEGFR